METRTEPVFLSLPGLSILETTYQTEKWEFFFSSATVESTPNWVVFSQLCTVVPELRWLVNTEASSVANLAGLLS